VSGEYRPGQATPRDVPNMARYLFRELQRVSEQFLNQDVAVKVKNAEPAKPFEGLMVIADGTNWNPGSGYGTYIYRNGAWRVIEV
jgi:hypothetical protein